MQAFHLFSSIGSFRLFLCIHDFNHSFLKKSKNILLVVFQLRFYVGGKALAAMSAKEQAGHVQCLGDCTCPD